MRSSHIIPLIFVAVLVAGMAICTVRAGQLPGGREKANQLPLKLGSAAPDFDLPTLDGRRVRLSDLRGKVVLLEFTATWCPACDRAASDTRELYKRFKGASFEAISISLDGGENTDTTVEDLARFVRRARIDWTVLFDDTGKDNLAAASYGVENLPAHFLVDKSGIIRSIVRGQTDSRQIRNQIRELLR